MLIILIGPPGSGKGTQCRLLSRHLGIAHYSTGEMLRDEIRRETPLGNIAGPLLAGGNFISDEVAINLIRNQLFREDQQITGLLSGLPSGLLDGFPRTLAQAVEFDRMIGQIGMQIDYVFELEVPESEVLRRLSDRYSNAEAPRPEDNAAAIPRRMEIYREATLPIIDFYRKQELLSPIDGSGSPEVVFTKIIAAIEAPPKL